MMREFRHQPWQQDAAWKRRLTIGVLVGALLLAGTTGALYAATSQITDSTLVACFTRAELRIDGSFPGTTVALAATGNGPDITGPDPILDPLSTCESMWQQGVLTPDTPWGTSGVPTSTVPDLQVCVLHDGMAAVVPGDEGICGTLGLSKASGH